MPRSDNRRHGGRRPGLVGAATVTVVGVGVATASTAHALRQRRLRRRRFTGPVEHREPAGIGTTPALPVERLNPEAWAALSWRQEHLPVDRLRTRADAGSMYHVERHAADRVADRLNLDEDQRYSLLARHNAEVQRRASAAAPGIFETTDEMMVRLRREGHRGRRGEQLLSRVLPGWMHAEGWPTWFANRRVDLHETWFRFLTRSRYKQAPRLAK